MLPQHHDSLSLDLLLDLFESHSPKFFDVNIPHFHDLVLLARLSGDLAKVELLILKGLARLYILLGFGFCNFVSQIVKVLFAE